ncbi:MAG: tRNA (adenosine(37)-N6)-threonylcarbamoyltransferase complex transferase subunit TsaD [Acidobacteriota bacterium]|nr:tRNA (adenosine(37)-N6)-threonylcarbamoyltransferase complex transferase subunit TsaD [Acidobacteriota bacterium]
MNVLGIETSCDETAAAVVSTTGDPARPWAIRSNVVASQVEIHREWGGVVPEIASRQHMRDICGVVERALADAAATLDDVDAIAVTKGPGLVGSLLVGVSFGKAVAAARGLPIVGVHHLAGHIESIFLEHGVIELPAVVLVVSGGHTSLYFMPRPGAYELIGRTRDDAAGEAFDKVAKLMGLDYPGGPALDRAAKGGDDRAVRFTAPRMTHRARHDPRPDLAAEFSFSGLKTAVVRHMEKRAGAPFAGTELSDLAASFQRTVVENLLDRTFEVASAFGAKSIGIAGGVSANSRLRADAAARGAATGIPVYIPRLALSTDNAAMIAAAGLRRLELGQPGPDDFGASADLPIS